MLQNKNKKYIATYTLGCGGVKVPMISSNY